MNEKNYEIALSLVPKSYLTLASQAHQQRQNLLTNLLAQVCFIVSSTCLIHVAYTAHRKGFQK